MIETSQRPSIRPMAAGPAASERRFRSGQPSPVANPGASRFMFYSHDGLGLGHLRRNLAIAMALTQADATASVLVATSVDEVHDLGLGPNVDVLRLPGLRKVGKDRYAATRLPIEVDGMLALRSELLTSAVRGFRPAVLLSDRHPLGIGGELVGALRALLAQGGHAILGLRDIVDEPTAARVEFHEHGMTDALSAYYDEVLVYGQEAILDPRLTYGLDAKAVRSLTFCGYVAAPTGSGDATRGDDRPLVLATTGGGEDGSRILETFVAASTDAPWRAIVVAGPQAPRMERERLEALADTAGVEFLTFVPSLGSLLGSVDALVSMGGYNTLVEALTSATPTVCIPRTRPRQEQAIRARAFAAHGLIEVIEPDELSVGRMREAVVRALRRSRHDIGRMVRRVLELDGAQRAASRLLAVAQSEAG